MTYLSWRPKPHKKYAIPGLDFLTMFLEALLLVLVPVMQEMMNCMPKNENNLFNVASLTETLYTKGFWKKSIYFYFNR